MSDELDLFGLEIEKYKEKYDSVAAKTEDKDFVDELFESSDGTPIKNWSIEDINQLITDVDSIPDVEQAGEDFEYDKYVEYKEPEMPDFSEPVQTELTEIIKQEKIAETYDESAVYFSKEYEQDLVNKATETEEIPTVFEDISSKSEDYKEDFEEITEEAEVRENEESMDFFEQVPDGDFSVIEGSVNEARADGEFREIDENYEDDFYEENEVVYDGTFDRGDYLQIKDIFKNSKFLSKRRLERAEVKENAMESIKEKYGEAIFEAKKKEEDFNDILRRQSIVEKEKREKEEASISGERRFDLDSQEYIVKSEPETKELLIQEDEDFDDTIFLKDFSAFEEVAKGGEFFPEENDTRIFEETREINTETNAYSSPVYTRNDDQMRFEGFPEEDEYMPEEVNAEDVKENLRKAREEKKNLFKMTSLPSDYDDIDPNYFSPEKGKYDEEECLVLSDENDPNSFFTMFKKSFVQEKNKKMTEYVSSNEKPQIFKELNDRRRRSIFGLIAMSALSIIFIAVQLLVNIIKEEGNAVTTALLAGVSIICVLMSFVFGSSVTQPGLKNMFKGRFTFDASTTLLLIALCISSVPVFFDLENSAGIYPVYTLPVLVCVVINCLGRAVESGRVISALKILTGKRKDDIYTIQTIGDPATAQNIGRVFAGSNPDLRYSCKTVFPTGFIANSFLANPADKFSKLLYPAFAALAVIVAVVSGIVNKNVVASFSTLMACLVVSLPVSVLLTLNVSLSSLNKKLERKKSCVTGYTSATSIDKANAIIVDATDLFDMSRCNFHGMKDYGTVRVDDIILYAAAMLTNSRGPLSHVFDKAIIGDKKELLPEVEDLYYEERLGLSGWIRGEKVFIGNRNLLINHNMEAPPKGAEVACLKEGKKVLYIAIDGKVAAMLVVEYAKDEETRKYLERLNKRGITVVVATNDCNIDEEFLSLSYNLPRESFKVVGDFEGGLLDDYIHRLTPTAPAKLIHSGTPSSLFETFSSAFSYSSSIKLTLIMQAVVMLLGFIFVSVMAIMGKFNIISSLVILLIQVISSLIITIVSSIRAKM